MSVSLLKRFAAMVTVLAAVSCANEPMPDPAVVYDLKITNARIVDGTGGELYEGGVLVKDGMIRYVGTASLSGYEAEETIDGRARHVTPGFIDAHAHGEPLRTPDFQNFWAQGVTTIVLGMDGGSSGMEDLPAWMERAEAAGLGVNIVPFTGHATARTAVGIGLEGQPTEAQLQGLGEWIRSQLEAGSFGVSTGIEYIPGRFAGPEELAAIGHVLREYDAVMMSHIRNEDADQVAASIRELIQVGTDSGAKVHVSHIKIVYANEPSQADAVLAVMDSARAAGVAVTADVYPYTASYTGISILYPEWALPPNDFEDALARRQELAEYLRNRVNRRNGPEATLIGTGPWAGKTLAVIAAELDKPFEEVLIDHLPPGSASAAYFVMNMDVMRRFLGDAHVVVSTDGSPTMLHPRGYGSFSRIIRQFVAEEQYLTLAEAVHKMSGQTATVIGLDHARGATDSSGAVPAPFALRGVLAAGYAADLLMFDPRHVEDRATFEKPHEYSAGFDYVVVNGTVVVRNGEPTGARAGRVLRAR